jgi:hypothetical protein
MLKDKVWFACALVALVATIGRFEAVAQSATPTPTIHIAVQGETNLSTNFVEEFKAESKALGLAVQIVERHSPDLDYSIVLAQESTFGSAAAAIIALDRDGSVAASVVRSGRMSGHGAINACTKELAKKLAILRK